MNVLSAVLLLLLSVGAYADEGFPPRCQPIAVQNESVMLKADKPMVVLIHNLSSSDLWITHPVSDPGASAGWSSRLQAGNWSALTVDKPSFELGCIESRPGHEQQVPCVGMIGVCEWTGVKIPAQLTGTFWAGEDMALKALTAHIGGRGFEIPVAAP